MYALSHQPCFASSIQLCHTSGLYPTVARLPDRTIGVRSRSGSATRICSMRGPVGAAYLSPLST